MRVKMLTTMAGPRGVSLPGTVCTVEDAEGQQLVDGGFAELVEGSKPKAGKSSKGGGKKDENQKPPANPNADNTPDPDDAGEGEEGGEAGDGAAGTGAPSA